MKKKAAIVMDVKDGYAVLLKCGEFVKVKDRGYKVGETVVLPKAKIKPFLTMAACLTLVFSACFSGYAAYRLPSDYIYMDINPSLRLDINCFGRVISLVPLNSDAEELLASYEFKDSDPESLMEKIVSACQEKSYINDENRDVEIDVSGKKTSLIKKADSVSAKLSEGDVTVSVKNITADENKKAINYKSSPKRLAAIEDYTRVFGGTLEENVGALSGVSVKEIREMIRSHTAPGEKKGQKKAELVPADTKITAEGTKEETEEGTKKKTEVTAETEGTAQETAGKSPGTVEHEKGKNSGNKKEDKTPDLKPSGKRLAAIEEYTKVFGGTVEENTLSLREHSVKEIREMIRAQKAEN